MLAERFLSVGGVYRHVQVQHGADIPGRNENVPRPSFQAAVEIVGQQLIVKVPANGHQRAGSR